MQNLKMINQCRRCESCIESPVYDGHSFKSHMDYYTSKGWGVRWLKVSEDPFGNDMLSNGLYCPKCLIVIDAYLRLS